MCIRSRFSCQLRQRDVELQSKRLRRRLTIRRLLLLLAVVVAVTAGEALELADAGAAGTLTALIHAGP